MTLYIEGFSRFVASTVAPIASGWSDSSPGGIRTHWKTVPLHGARNNIRLKQGVLTEESEGISPNSLKLRSLLSLEKHRKSPRRHSADDAPLDEKYVRGFCRKSRYPSGIRKRC
jgi:hypothetical protein